MNYTPAVNAVINKATAAFQARNPAITREDFIAFFACASGTTYSDAMEQAVKAVGFTEFAGTYEDERTAWEALGISSEEYLTLTRAFF